MMMKEAGEEEEEEERRGRFGDLRGVQWRIHFRLLPSPQSSSDFSIDHLRRQTANSRRRYVALRRHLLIDPPLIAKQPTNSPPPPPLIIDNPLSLNPDSMWGRFFKNAELERMLDQDLSRLYPQQGSYFQTPECQGMLRRILLLWCLTNPDYGYRQGMHDLLAPLLYVLHLDIAHLSQVQNNYGQHFTDKFDAFSFHENDFTHRFDFKKYSNALEDETRPQNIPPNVTTFDELDPKVKDIILLCDAYGAEGELGIVLSKKFMEHDAYCMFEALMNGAGGAVAMVEFFSHSPLVVPHTGIPPVIEASSALYHLLSLVDSSLHSHLVELGVEPQYFALRWLRVLFGREFVLEDLLTIWDEIFASDNNMLHQFGEDDIGSTFRVLNSSRGAFISALAVSMILHLRSSLLATENATSCLQRLLNFPDDINVEKLIAKGKSLQGLALDICNSTPVPTDTRAYNPGKSVIMRGHSLPSDSVLPTSGMSFVRESYWEEKWRVLHKEEEIKEGSFEKKLPTRIKGWSEKSGTESGTSTSKVNSGRSGSRTSVRRSLLKDLARQLGSEEGAEDVGSGEDLHREDAVGEPQQDVSIDNFGCTSDDDGNVGSKEESLVFSDPPSPTGGANNQEHKSDRTDDEQNNGQCSTSDLEPLPLSTLDLSHEVCLKSEHNVDSTGESTDLKDQKPVPGKFQWFWKFGRNAGDGAFEKGCSPEAAKASTDQRTGIGSSTTESLDNASVIGKGGSVDQNVMVTFKNLGQTMIENIQVIESAFLQDWGQAGPSENNTKNGLMGRGQFTAVAALKELRKLSSILSEM